MGNYDSGDALPITEAVTLNAIAHQWIMLREFSMPTAALKISGVRCAIVSKSTGAWRFVREARDP
jgi:hypothetical protein